MRPVRNTPLVHKALDDIFGSVSEGESISGYVTAILRNVETGLVRVHQTRNIITDAGDVYYAQSAAGEAVTNAFDTLWLGTANASTPGKLSDSDDITFIAGSAKLVKATYPLTNDGDADNTGAATDVLTWTFEYAAGDFNDGAITDGMIGVGAHGVAKPALTHFEFTGGAFAKTASDTLKVIVNHTFNGV